MSSNTAVKRVISEARLYEECGKPRAGLALVERAKTAMPAEDTLSKEAARLATQNSTKRAVPSWAERVCDALYLPAIIAACAITAVLLRGILLV